MEMEISENVKSEFLECLSFWHGCWWFFWFLGLFLGGSCFVLVCFFLKFKQRSKFWLDVLFNLTFLVHCYMRCTGLITHFSHWRKNPVSLQKELEAGDKVTAQVKGSIW